MGTEHVGPLLYALLRMHRPRRALAIGLGYSTLFLLQALADNEVEARRDAAVAAGTEADPLRREVLHPQYPHAGHRGRLHGIDDFSDDPGRLDQFLGCVEHLGLQAYFTLERCRYQDAARPLDGFDFMWMDCGHQLDYAPMLNRFWPLLDDDGGLLAMHYTYVDIDTEDEHGRKHKLMMPGPFINAVRQQLLQAGLQANFETLSLIEPHKCRQGSVSLLRKLDDGECCRPSSLTGEQSLLYGEPGQPLAPLTERAGEMD
ncbi:class I SAM-dependent methyltransferase [Chromobacterium sp. CV08]|uniref:class I SAM-dependent methyltransferase n=1 Tax=Chromobacterium sp. CV08 TaxID=3133274 RepID=UPI003DA8DFF6